MTLDKEKTNFDYYWIHRSSVWGAPNWTSRFNLEIIRKIVPLNLNTICLKTGIISNKTLMRNIRREILWEEKIPQIGLNVWNVSRLDSIITRIDKAKLLW